MPTRMEVHYAIERLIKKSWDEEAARTIVAFGAPLPTTRGGTTSFRRKQKEDFSLTGFTHEHGDVQYEVQEDEQIEIKEDQLESKKERVGYYKLYKYAEGQLQFHHYWKSDLQTQGMTIDFPAVYTVCYDPQTLQPTAFGVWETKRVFRIPLLLGEVVIFKNSLNPLHGEIWGISFDPLLVWYNS